MDLDIQTKTTNGKMKITSMAISNVHLIKYEQHLQFIKV